MSMQTIPTYDDAHLVLKLYELRRDEKLRTAREWFVGRFFPRSGADIETLYAAPGNENVYFRMVTSYWDMAASFVVRGVLNADLLLDSAGEMVLVWAKLEEHVGQIRGKIVSTAFLSNLERVMQSSAYAREKLAAARQTVARLRDRAAAHPPRS
ncbi:MAG TPA: hypothetical protein VKH43_13660 [Thermoanaerobaculia bacterium]|nr:hypothetical protein [Thermoanaerobaculia bacterium]